MKRLYKSRKERIIDGVCGGIAEYFEIDPVIVRLIAVILFLTGGVGFVAYIVGMIIIPTRPVSEESDSTVSGEKRSVGSRNTSVAGVILLILGILFLFRTVPAFNGCYWWIRSLSWNYIVPIALILAGIYFLAKKKNDSTGIEKKDFDIPEKK